MKPTKKSPAAPEKTSVSKRSAATKKASPQKGGTPAAKPAAKSPPEKQNARAPAPIFATGPSRWATGSKTAPHAMPIESLLFAATLARYGKSGEAPETERAAPATTPIDEMAGGTHKLVPGSKQWKLIGKKLLRDETYNPGREIDSLETDDPVRILSSIPFQFRGKARELLKLGICIFFKVPYTIGSPTAAPEPIGVLRPVGCPEGPGETNEFHFAWFDGSLFHCEAPSRTHPAIPLVDPLEKSRADFSGSTFHNDLLGIASMLTLFADMCERFTRMGAPTCSPYYLLKMKEMIHRLANDKSQAALAAGVAFACGFLYCKTVAYPGCTKQDGKRLLGRDETRFRIVLFALLRHGHGTNRKMLLERLGCENAQDYKKDSSEVARFAEEHSRHTPEFTFATFDKAYKEAKKHIDELSSEGTAESQSRPIEKAAKKTVSRHKRAQRQRDNQAETRRKASGYDEIQQQAHEAEIESSVKEKVKEKQRQQTANRVAVARDIPTLAPEETSIWNKARR